LLLGLAQRVCGLLQIPLVFFFSLSFFSFVFYIIMKQFSKAPAVLFKSNGLAAFSGSGIGVISKAFNPCTYLFLIQVFFSISMSSQYQISMRALYKK